MLALTLLLKQQGIELPAIPQPPPPEPELLVSEESLAPGEPEAAKEPEVEELGTLPEEPPIESSEPGQVGADAPLALMTLNPKPWAGEARPGGADTLDAS